MSEQHDTWNLKSFGGKPNFLPPRIMEVIVYTTIVGQGIKTSPYREIGIVATLEGEIIAHCDEWANKKKSLTGLSIYQGGGK